MHGALLRPEAPPQFAPAIWANAAVVAQQAPSYARTGAGLTRETEMTRLQLLSVVVGATVFAATPISLHLSRTMSPSLSTDTADARVGRPLTPVSVAGVNRRQNRRAAYGYGAGAVGAGLGAAAIGTAAAVGAAPYYGSGYYGGTGYYGGGPYASYSGAPYAAAPVQSPAPAFGTFCVPGTMVQMQDGQMHLCQ
jgi:hypothetical protein